jgi:hypothetical protein
MEQRDIDALKKRLARIQGRQRFLREMILKPTTSNLSRTVYEAELTNLDSTEKDIMNALAR